MEMIKLLRLLVEIYEGENRLFVSWDSASWHASKALYKAVDEINSDAFRIHHKTPLVDLMPLPSGAQFLNVIGAPLARTEGLRVNRPVLP